MNRACTNTYRDTARLQCQQAMKSTRIWALIGQLLIFISGCGIQFEPVSDEIRRGPEGSFFAGGLDGGKFVLMSGPSPVDGLYHGKLFYENGDLLYAGPFRYSAHERSFDAADPALYSGWDGERLYLRDYTYLTPTEPILPL